MWGASSSIYYEYIFLHVGFMCSGFLCARKGDNKPNGSCGLGLSAVVQVFQSFRWWGCEMSKSCIPDFIDTRPGLVLLEPCRCDSWW